MSALNGRRLAFLALLALAACGGAGGAPEGTAAATGAAEARALGIIGGVQRALGGLRSDDAVSAPRTIPGGFTPEAVAAEPGAYRLVQVNALGLNEAARVIQDNGGDETLALQSGPTAAYESGILTATRGFGDDLMAFDAPGLLQALRAGGGQVARRMELLDSQDQISIATFACTVTAAGQEDVNLGIRTVSLRRLDENCRGERVIFDNIYWLDGEGRIVASRQYVSPTVAYLRSNRL